MRSKIKKDKGLVSHIKKIIAATKSQDVMMELIVHQDILPSTGKFIQNVIK
jgi:hypothetical protein